MLTKGQQMTTVAVLGTGIMGAPMARNLAKAGLTVRAWNRSREKAEPLAADGVSVHGTVAEAVEAADAVVTMSGPALEIRPCRAGRCGCR